MTEYSEKDISTFWSVAHAAADAARVETMSHFRRVDLAAESKDTHFDPVTVADRAAEAAMRRIISAHRPDDGILG